MILSKPLILGSGSPRRQEIMRNAGFNFKVEVKPTSELFSDKLSPEEVPVFLAKQKLNEFNESYKDKLVLCSDTVVILDGQILNKPKDKEDAIRMLRALSGKKHRVVTGVAYKTGGNVKAFKDACHVTFAKLSEVEIEHYIRTCQPLDKAGSYGIQDFLGMVGVTKLEGSYYTVMGLPIHMVYAELKEYISF